MVLRCPVSVLVLHALTEMDVCGKDSVSVDRAV
jgi:hypothetical protein